VELHDILKTNKKYLVKICVHSSQSTQFTILLFVAILWVQHVGARLWSATYKWTW